MEELLGFINTCKTTKPTPRPGRWNFDRNALTFLREQYPEVPTTADGAVFLELETTEEKMDEALDRLFEAIEASNGMAEESWMALDRSEQEKSVSSATPCPSLSTSGSVGRKRAK